MRSDARTHARARQRVCATVCGVCVCVCVCACGVPTAVERHAVVLPARGRAATSRAYIFL